MQLRRLTSIPFLFAAAGLALAHDDGPGHQHAHDDGHAHGHAHAGLDHKHPHETANAVILNAANWDEFAPHGKETDAIYGDAVLVNRYLTAVIAAPLPTRNANMTVRNVGGQLIDLTVNDQPNDQLSALYVLKRRFVFAGLTMSTTKSQLFEDGQPVFESSAEVRTTGTDPKTGLKAELTYSLRGDSKFLAVRTLIENPTDAPVTIALGDDLRFDAGRESASKSADGANAFHWFGDDHWGQAYAVVPGEGWSLRTRTDARVHDIIYTKPGNDAGEVTLAAGASFAFVRQIYAGPNTLAVQSQVLEAKGQKIARATIGAVDAAGAPVPDALVRITGPDGFAGWGRTDEKGTLIVPLPVGTYAVTAKVQGIPQLEAAPVSLAVAAGDKSARGVVMKLDAWKPGTVAAKITDDAGNPIACKVEFLGKEGTPTPNFGPDSAVYGVRNLRYAPLGTFRQTIGSGSYTVRVSHGPEYDAWTGEIRVNAGTETPLLVRLHRSVATPGWVSADFHSHSSPSGDNTSSQLGRVLNLVAEHVEFAPCTEHNRVETYDPEIAELKVGHAVRTVSGLELTGSPLPLNHQNAFPLKYVPRTQDGGAPVTDADPSVQIERLFGWDNGSEKLIQQNHPDIGWLFFDKDGDGKPDGGYPGPRKFMDVMEIHPIDMVTSFTPTVEYRGRESTNQMFGWLQLLNQGYRIPGVVNTDAHYNYHGSGGLRNWVASSTDDPAKIDILEMVRNSEKGHLIMSNGPFLEFDVRESGKDKAVIAGSDLAAASGKVTLRLKVQCPNWIDIDRVFVLVNGKLMPELDFRKADQPGAFRSGSVRFEAEREIALPADAHLIAVTVGESSKLGPVMGPDWGEQMPTAVTNPVFVDVDGNGFQPNKDTLGHPLPVKFAPRPR